MANKHNTTKNDKVNLERRINIRLSEEQYSELESDMINSGFYSLPKYIRYILKKKKIGDFEASVKTKQYIKTLSATNAELRKISQNISSLTFAIRRAIDLKDVDGKPIITTESVTRGLNAVEKLLEKSNENSDRILNKILEIEDGCQDPESI